MDNKKLASIFFIVFIDLVGFGLILPLLPYIATNFGATEGLIGLIAAAYPATQMIGAPILGRLSDKYGRRPILLISIFGTAIGYVLLGFANTILLLFISRMIDGLTGGNISVAQAYIADITDEKNRAKGMGMIGAAFGMGFIIGPAIGGILSKDGFFLPAMVAVGLSMISFLGVLFWLPESLTDEIRKKNQGKMQPSIFNLHHLRATLKRPIVGPLLILRFWEGFAFNTFQTIFSLYALTRFHLTQQQTGFIFAYIGVLVVITQAIIIRSLVKKFSEANLLVISISMISLALFGYGLATSVPFLLFILIPLAIGAGTFNTVINSSLSKAVSPKEVGGIMGLSSSSESLTRVISPAISGFLIGINPSIPGIVGGIIAGFMIPYTIKSIVKQKRSPVPQTP